tara:strand:+ start:1285 stop:4164 length:2880 start_codon:yes stop_codon:yes gene_type:complete
MPKKTFTINGFTGGLNTKKDFNDLDHKSNKAECHFSDGLSLDEGSISANRIFAQTTTDITFPEGCDDSANKFIVVPQSNGTVKGYTEKGVYAHGEDVNWSNNANYKVFPPSEGIVNPHDYTGNNHNYGINLTVYPEREDDRLILIGSEAQQYPRSITSTNRLGKICDETILGDGSTSGARAPDDFVQINHGGDQSTPDKIGEGRDYWDDSWSGGEDFHFFVDDSVAPNRTDVMFTGVNDYNTTNIDLTESTNSYHINNTASGKLNSMAFYRNGVNTSSNYESTGIVFRAGRVDSTANGTQDDGLYGHSAPTLDNYYIHLEYRLVQDDAGFLGFRVLLDTDNNDMAMHWDTNPISGYAKAWDFTVAELENGVEQNAYFGTVTKSWTESIHTGSLFSPGDVKLIWVVPMFSGEVNAGTTRVCEIRELSFIKKPKTSNMWGNRKYAFYQSQISNGVESLLTKYDCKIFGNNPGASVNVGYYQTVYNSLNFSFYVPQAQAVNAGKIYYRECTDYGEPYGEHFLLAEWDKTDGFKYKFSGNEWIHHTSGNNVTVPVNVHTPPKETTFELETGYPDGTEDINAEWVASAVIGSQVYIGNVKGVVDGQWRTSKILKTTNGRHAGFSDKDFIDLDLQGDEITVMESSGDRLFVFCKKDLYIINVAQDIEYIEATLPGMGIERYGQVTKVNEGLAFINASGIYYFDGRGTKDITSEKIGKLYYKYNPASISNTIITPQVNSGTFSINELNIDADDCAIYFEPNENNLIAYINTDTAGPKILVYNLERQCWIYTQSNSTESTSKPFNISISNSALIKSASGSGDPGMSTYYVPKLGTQASYIDYIDTTYGATFNSHHFGGKLFTGTIDCGDINRRKKFYYLYLNGRNWSSSQKCYVFFSVDRGTTWYQATREDSSSENFIKSGENKFNIKSSGKSILVAFGNPSPNAATWSNKAFITDISIVFRERTVK